MTSDDLGQAEFEAWLRRTRGNDLECYDLYHNALAGCRNPKCAKYRARKGKKKK